MLNSWTSLVVQWGQKKKKKNAPQLPATHGSCNQAERVPDLPGVHFHTYVWTCILYLHIYFLYLQKYLALGVSGKHNWIILYVFLFYLLFSLTINFGACSVSIHRNLPFAFQCCPEQTIVWIYFSDFNLSPTDVLLDCFQYQAPKKALLLLVCLSIFQGRF